MSMGYYNTEVCFSLLTPNTTKTTQVIDEVQFTLGIC